MLHCRMHLRLFQLFIVLVSGGCSTSGRDSSEAAWQRGQCEQIVDTKMREKCLEQVDRESGIWRSRTEPPSRKAF
jgi:hypothetical protein